MDKILPAYFTATAGAVAVSVGSSQALARAAISESLRTSLKRFVPFLSVGFANCLNTYTMRRHEMTEGIDVFAFDPVTGRKGKKNIVQ